MVDVSLLWESANSWWLWNLLLLLLSHFSHVWLCATPSLGFSSQKHWSGLPFPSPMHKSEKWKWSRSAMSNSSRPHGLQLTRLLRPWNFPGKSTGVGCHCLLRSLSVAILIDGWCYSSALAKFPFSLGRHWKMYRHLWQSLKYYVMSVEISKGKGR